MMRPVFNLDLAQTELIGTFEQVYMDISISDDEIRPNVCVIQIYNKILQKKKNKFDILHYIYFFKKIR